MKRILTCLCVGLFAAAGGSVSSCATSSSGVGGGGGIAGGGNVGGGGFAGSSAAGGFGGSGAVGGFGGSGAVGGFGGSGATGATGGTGNTGGTGATGGTGGSTGNGQLGAACNSNAECGGGLTCILPNSAAWDGEGPAKGYCTKECTQTPDCTSSDPTSECLSFDSVKAYCLKGCTIGTPFGAGKCHGRAEVGCTQYLRSAALGACGTGNTCPAGQACATDGQCHATFSACGARCAIDADCPSGMKCNPDSGLCTTKTLTGKTLGQTCTNQTNECQGFCVGVTGTTSRFCSQQCVIGVPNSCGWPGPGSKGNSLCGLSFDVAATNGDTGACVPLCDCNSQCPTGFICNADANIQTNAQRKGSCSPGTTGGIASCT